MPSDSVDLSLLRRDAMGQIRDTVTLVLQTLFYGIYVLLMAFFIYKRLQVLYRAPQFYILQIFSKKGLNSTTRRLMFSMILFMFTLSTASWACNFGKFIQKIIIHYVHQVPDAERDGIFAYDTLIDAIILVNYILTDGVVVWRAWVLCGQDLAYRWLIWIPTALLSCTTLSILTTITIRVVLSTGPNPATNSVLSKAIDYSQVINLVVSLLTNIFATLIIGLKAWKHRQWITKDLKLAHTKNSRSEKVLYLLIESGLLYCISGTTVLICTVIRLPIGTLGDIYTPVNVQIAGIYPIVVLLFVDYQSSQGGTIFENTKTQGEVTGVRSRSRFESLRFASPREGNTMNSDAHIRSSETTDV